MDPEPLTLRELCWMAEAVQRAEWERTSSVLAMLANVNRDPKKTRRFRPDDFNPFSERRRQGAGIPITPGNIGMLKRLVKR